MQHKRGGGAIMPARKKDEPMDQSGQKGNKQVAAGIGENCLDFFISRFFPRYLIF